MFYKHNNKVRVFFTFFLIKVQNLCKMPQRYGERVCKLYTGTFGNHSCRPRNQQPSRGISVIINSKASQGQDTKHIKQKTKPFNTTQGPGQ